MFRFKQPSSGSMTAVPSTSSLAKAAILRCQLVVFFFQMFDSTHIVEPDRRIGFDAAEL
jgi:hypothetical protein